MLIGDPGNAVVADDEGTADASTIGRDEHALLLGVDAHKLADHGRSPQSPECAHEGQGSAVHTQHETVQKHERCPPVSQTSQSAPGLLAHEQLQMRGHQTAELQSQSHVRCFSYLSRHYDKNDK